MHELSYKLFEVGHCRHCERITRKSGSFRSTRYPAIVGLIDHPSKGKILFDTGYSSRFFQYTQHFPFNLYRFLTPVELKQDLKTQIEKINVSAEEVNFIILSHLHADHIGGAKDFPNAQLVIHPDALVQAQIKSRFKALLKGFLPQLLPDNYLNRIHSMGKEITLPAKLSPFTKGYDLFSDGSIILVELPGHAIGQLGAFINTTSNAFFIADSCWHIDAIQKSDLPSKITALVHDNWQQYLDTILKLQKLNHNNQQINLIPSHCVQTFERLR